jgi:PAS domain S-box-containing protein
MGPAMRSALQNPFGTVLPHDVASLAVERLNDIVMVTETEPFEEPGLRILFVNPAFERITGYSAGEVLGRSPRFLRGPGTSAEEVLRIETAMRARRPVKGELLNYKRDGTPFWVEIEVSTATSASTGAEYFVCVERDITERRGAEVALRERERSIDTLFSNLPGMAYRCLNDSFWTMEFVSDGCHELTGYEAAELTGNRKVSYESIIHPEDRKTVREADTGAGQRNAAFEITYRIRTREGAVKWVLERGRSISGPDGEPEYFEGFISDVTERKLLEVQVFQGQRLESIGTLAGGIAHDLNNVFAPIMMAGDLLGDKMVEKDAAQLLNVIAASARRGAELVRQVLLFARGMEGPRIEVSPKALFEEIRPFLESTFPKSIRLEFSVDPATPPISGDPAQLHQLLLNLSVNARDAMPAGGRLSITARPASISPSAHRPHPDAMPGDFAQIDIADTGTGIPDALKGQIFDPFFTTKGVGRGSGLGLSTARSIAKAHRGFITFVSAEGAGTTFSIFLPTIDLGLAQPDRGAAAVAPVIQRGASEHILIVDDEESVRLIMASSLESFGFRVSTAAGGAEALTIAANSHEHFDLALIDMQMPGLDGIKTIAALRHAHPNLPIVGASGFATTQHREEAAANGIRHFLDKPFSVETLVRTVHAAMAKAAA